MSVVTESAPRAARSAGRYPVCIALVGHLVGAALLWWVVSAPDISVVYNDEFVRWALFAVTLGAVLAAAVGLGRRSWRSTARASLGVAVALVLELAMFAAWIISHSK